MGATRALFFVCVVHIIFGLDSVLSKPASSSDSPTVSQIPSSFSGPGFAPLSSSPAAARSSSASVPRKVVTSWSDNGWQGSARLPSSSQTGGNENSSTKDLTNGRTTDRIDVGRNNRRLHKWEKTEEISDEAETENDDGEGTNLAQSLNSMTSHLLEKADESLENSSERDVFIEGNKNEDGTSTDQNETDEMTSDEEASPTNDPKTASISTWHDEEVEDKMTDKLKSDGNPTTPKGLTTWSAVNGGGGSYIKGSVQKIPSEYTVSGALSFNGVDRSTSSVDLVTKERSSTNQPTTEIPRTTKSNTQSTSASTATVPMLNSKKRKPYHKNKKVVQPSKFVKQPLAEITAEAIGTDATHTIYKTKVIDAQTKVAADYAYTTKKPQWPYQLPAKKIVTTKRPMAFSRITAKPKNPYVPKRPLTPMTLSNPTTTTPSTTTTYHRNPAPLMYPFPTISFTNLGLMDFLRSQIIPRIGLSLISFMAASPLILSMIGATAVGRKRRSLDTTQIMDTDRVQFEYISNPNIKNLPKFDFSTIKKKLNKLEMIHQKKPRKSIATQVTEIVSKLMKSKAFSMLKSKFLEAHDSPQQQDSRISRDKSKH